MMRDTDERDASVRVPALFVDLYELTMASVYTGEAMNERACFSLFVRALPPERRFLLAAGLDDALTWIEALRFTDADLAYLETLDLFPAALLDWLREFRFSGDIFAVPEGTPVFANEPLLEVEAPIAEAQLVETALLNLLSYGTLVASKGIRVVLAADGRAVIDFGARRTHGVDAAIAAARALYVAGFAATSNVEAGRRYGIPVSGTMAHSFIQAHEDERDAFRMFARHFPRTTLLVDTYDTLAGVQHVVDLARELGDDFRVRAIRLDSGDLAALAKDSRALLNAAGLDRVQIVASGGLDEHSVAALRAAGAPIDAFAVGTRVNASADAPTLESVYKLVEYAGTGRRKLSTKKATLPYRKQVFRRFADGAAVGDAIAVAGEDLPGEPLLVPVMRAGRRLEAGSEPIEDSRRRAADAVARLPSYLRDLEPGGPDYPVSLSPRLSAAVEG